ncbi:hypothetical protein DPMN_008633 [Dreissena polymorpha]|uniref:Uncharacterized protein n=1 Tax=Dreissena polymorpha TaxID=45954 RepID=A0A9D4MYF7_DREPO|nr:hypothetical protein DPMN_008633 [Dreissena polymorpha]
MMGTAVHVVLRAHFLVDTCQQSQLKEEMTLLDPEIQILMDQAEELQSLLRGETTLADATCSEILIKLDRA